MGEERKEKQVLLRIREGSRIYGLLERNPGRPYAETLTKALEDYIDYKSGDKIANVNSVALHTDTKTMKDINRSLKEINMKLEPFEKVYFEFYLKVKKLFEEQEEKDNEGNK